MYKVNYTNIVDYWKKFFPELEDIADIEKLLNETSGVNFKKLKYLWEEDNGETQHKKFIEDLFADNKSYHNVSEIIENFSQKDFPYIYFISPFLYHTLNKTKQKLKKTKIIYDKKLFLKNLVEDCYIHTYPFFIKTIVLEINIARENGWLVGDTPKDRADYYKFVLLKDDRYLREIYKEYSSLVKLVYNTLENYINYVYDIIEATEKEKSLLEDHFDCNLGHILHIETSTGDAHSGGKAVAIIQFTSGVKLVIKPRNMLLERGYNQFIETINKKIKGDFLKLKVAKVHNTQSFSWMEFIEYKSCSSKKEVSNFYKRIGQYLCILYSLNAKDFHHENLIAMGENPVLIDLEAILHVGKQEINYNSVHDYALDIIEDSVYSIYLLPTRSLFSNTDGKVNTFDIGGTGATEKQLAPFQTPSIVNNHSDVIKIIKDYTYVDIENNNPQFNDEIIRSEDYIDEIQEGFYFVYKWILENKDLYLNLVKRFFDGVNSRVIIKPTFLYAQLLSISYHPDLLRNSIHRNIFFNRIGLAQSFIDNKNIPNNEYLDLLAGDIPYFSINSNELVLRNSQNEIIPGIKLRNSPIKTVINKIDEMNLEDMEFQSKIIDFTFMHTASGSSVTTGIHFNRNINLTKTVNKQDYLDIAIKIGDKMIQDSLYNSDRTEQTWFGLMIMGKDEVFTRFSSIEYDLYKGNSGIALYFAYLAYATGETKYKEAAFNIIKSCVDLLKSLDDDPLVYDIGAFTGISGIIYSVFHVGKVLKIDEYKAIACKSVDYLVKNIKIIEEFEIISGCSGALGVILSLFENTRDAKTKNNLMVNSSIIVEHIIKYSTKHNDMILWGSYKKDEGYTGFAHGTSGITATLMRYYKHKKDPKVLEVIKDALKFENHLFSSETNNWKLNIEGNSMSVAWCHGASGILLNRALMLKHGYGDKKFIMTDIKHALETTIERGFGLNYVLCHGDAGNLAIIYQLAEVLNDTNLKHYCDLTLNDMFNKFIKNNWNKNTFRSANMFGLMIGLAGLGYIMLKYGCDQNMPNILWLE